VLGIRGRLEDDPRSLRSMLDGSIDMDSSIDTDAIDVDVGMPGEANRYTMKRLEVIE